MKKILLALLLPFILSSCGNNKDAIQPQYKDITETVFASGVLEPEGKYNLVAQSDGYIVALNFKEGDLVKQGDVLAIVDNQPNSISENAAAQLIEIARNNISANAPALKQAEAAIKLAEEKLKQDENQLNRYKNLYASKSVSKLEFENIQLAYDASKSNFEIAQQTYQLQKQLAEQQFINQSAQKNTSRFYNDNNKIKAVVGGKVYRKMKEAGDYVRRGDVLANIGNATDIYARLNVDESNISKVKLGQTALVQLNTNKEKNINGVVSEIYPAFDDASQSFICKVKFTETLPFTISGTQLQANISIGSKKNVLVIPRAYLAYGNKVNIKGNAESVVVQTGFVSSDWVEITGGLKAEDIILPVSK